MIPRDFKFNIVVPRFLAWAVGMQNIVNATVRGMRESMLTAHSRLLKFSPAFDRAPDRVCRLTGKSFEESEDASERVDPILLLLAELLIPASA